MGRLARVHKSVNGPGEDRQKVGGKLQRKNRPVKEVRSTLQGINTKGSEKMNRKTKEKIQRKRGRKKNGPSVEGEEKGLKKSGKKQGEKKCREEELSRKGNRTCGKKKSCQYTSGC